MILAAYAVNVIPITKKELDRNDLAEPAANTTQTLINAREKVNGWGF